LQKWFEAITLVLKSEKKVSVRKLASEINVNKNTALQMLNKINDSITHTGQKLSDELGLEKFVKGVEKQLSIPMESFKKLIRNMMGTQEKY
jgi:DNA-binding transcriptional regulator YhcF (GntR family)